MQDSRDRFEQIGRALFGKFANQTFRILDRMGYSDDFIYSGKHDEFLQEGFIAGWSPRRMVETILVLESCEMISLDRKPSWN